MPRAKSANTKRNREVAIQAWFDTGDPGDKKVLEIVATVQRDHNLSKKEVLKNAILCAGEHKWAHVIARYADVSPTVVSSELRNLASVIADGLEEIRELLLTGVSINSSGVQKAFNDTLSAAGRLSAMEQSIADEYVEYFDEDDD